MQQELPSGFSVCPFDSRFIIWKKSAIFAWELCLANEFDDEGYPPRVAYIFQGDPGLMENATNLAWRIVEEYRGQGIMNSFLEQFLLETSPNMDCFAVVVLKTNTASLRLALRNGFTIYAEDDDKVYLKR